MKDRCCDCKHFEFEVYYNPEDDEEFEVCECKAGNNEHINWFAKACKHYIPRNEDDK